MPRGSDVKMLDHSDKQNKSCVALVFVTFPPGKKQKQNNFHFQFLVQSFTVSFFPLLDVRKKPSGNCFLSVDSLCDVN